jgi:hypothetical protein
MAETDWQRSIDPKLLRCLVRPLYAGLIARDKVPNILIRTQRMLGHVSLADEITAKWQSEEGREDGALPLAIGFWLRERVVDSVPQPSEYPRLVAIIRREIAQPTAPPTRTVEKRLVTNSVRTHLIERKAEIHHYHERLIVRSKEMVNT